MYSIVYYEWRLHQKNKQSQKTNNVKAKGRGVINLLLIFFKFFFLDLSENNLLFYIVLQE